MMIYKSNNKSYIVSSGFRTIEIDNEEIEVTAINLKNVDETDKTESHLGIIFRVDGNITLFNTFEIPLRFSITSKNDLDRNSIYSRKTFNRSALFLIVVADGSTPYLLNFPPEI